MGGQECPAEKSCAMTVRKSERQKKMKRRRGEAKQHFNHRLFQTRTASIFRHQAEVAKANLAKHKALVGSAGGKITLAVIRNLVSNALSVPCLYCREPITVRNFSLDHKIPVSRGGTLEAYNAEIICLPCNQRKGALTDCEFYALISLLHDLNSEASQDVLRRLRAGSKALGRMFWKGKGKPGPSAPPA